ncbi:cell division protein ZapE [Candidatus Ichthyocystis hellenicum]|uniref:cell division protein ZapE n=1 Tax=Candidatus Ichthyocystis hellenicum TaxID=1561003 RepID=UPI000B817758|nr:cell division protein ZapE [Candidatus Ichthyocystis hellenicum]
MLDLKKAYRDSCVANDYKEDDSQRSAICAIESIIQSLIDRQNFWGRMTVTMPPSVYIFGPPGYGKTFLMDLVYRNFPLPGKKRMHFHEFMRCIHDYFANNSHLSDPIMSMVNSMEYQYLFLDEFYVSDIADAMILGRLLKGLDDKNIFVIATSNFEISNLYPDGLCRDRFLSTINWMNDNYHTISMVNGVDFRLEGSGGTQRHFFSPHSESAEKFFEGFFIDKNEGKLQILNRPVRYYRRGLKEVWFTYSDICQTARSSHDYLVLSEMFSTFIVSCIPEFDDVSSTHLRRFTFLIDVLYDRRIKLFISSSIPIDRWSYSGMFSDQFARTISRLFEMREDRYDKPS